jgi:hypothetical protein
MCRSYLLLFLFLRVYHTWSGINPSIVQFWPGEDYDYPARDTSYAGLCAWIAVLRLQHPTSQWTVFDTGWPEQQRHHGTTQVLE